MNANTLTRIHEQILHDHYWQRGTSIRTKDDRVGNYDAMMAFDSDKS